MKKIVIRSGIAVVVIMLLVYVFVPKKQEPVEAILPNVRVMEIETSSNQEQMKFVGFIQPKSTYEGTFATIGTINQVNVKEGDQVNKGTALMSIDDETARVSLTNAQESYDVALSNQKQAKALMDAEAKNLESEQEDYQNQVNQAKEEVTRLDQSIAEQQALIQQLEDDPEDQTEALIEANAQLVLLQSQREVAQALVDDLESETPASIEIAQSRYDAAKAAHDATTAQTSIALNNVKSAQDNVKQTTLRSQIDGTVVAVVQEVGDLATPLIPSVVVASNEKVAVFGLSQSTVNLVEVDMKATITAQDKTFEGLVSEIALIPDSTSRTYEAKVDVETEEQLNLGETVQIIIDIKETEGVWLNINLLSNNGQDFVYVVAGGRINRRIVEKLAMQNDMVLVKNLQKGDLIVVEGFQSLKVGDQVNIVREDHD